MTDVKVASYDVKQVNFLFSFLNFLNEEIDTGLLLVCDDIFNFFRY